MTRKIAGYLLLAICYFLLAACNPPSLVNEYREKSKYPYPSDLRSSVMYLALEKNDQPGIMASGFIINKEKGIILNAKHFTDDIGFYGPEYCKAFPNGKVYRAELDKVPPLRDASLLRIIDPFDPADLPDPLPIAQKMPEFGDKVYVLGFHPHVYGIQEQNKNEGFADRVIPILKTYYDIVMKDKTLSSEVVFDKLEGTRIKPDPAGVLDETLRKFYENDSFIKLQMARDHKFSFGGLSGGAAVNAKGEVVGVITAQDPFRFEFDENGFMMLPTGDVVATVKLHKYDVLYITPIDAIKDLLEYAR